MTVGLYINEPSAIMISDCLVIPGDGNSLLLNPSNIEQYDGSNGEYATLVSKFIYADESTIISFAGAYTEIKDFIRFFPHYWEKRSPDLRPMQYLKELDYQFRHIRGSSDCDVLGASVIGIDGESKKGVVNNYASKNKNWKFKTKNFGTCFAIGTGSSELREFVENADANIDFSGSAGEMWLFKILGALNGKSLYGQHAVMEKQTWGGLLQAQIYNIAYRRWFRTPPWFHFCVYWEGTELIFKGIDKKFALHTSIRDALYASSIATWTIRENGRIEKIIWPIQSLFFLMEKEKIYHKYVIEEPNLITITSRIRVRGRNIINHATYNALAVQGVKYKHKTEPFPFSVDIGILRDWLREEMLSDVTISHILR